jgi:hypothetical protein
MEYIRSCLKHYFNLLSIWFLHLRTVLWQNECGIYESHVHYKTFSLDISPKKKFFKIHFPYRKCFIWTVIHRYIKTIHKSVSPHGQPLLLEMSMAQDSPPRLYLSLLQLLYWWSVWHHKKIVDMSHSMHVVHLSVKHHAIINRGSILPLYEMWYTFTTIKILHCIQLTAPLFYRFSFLQLSTL